jgi:hypothetical protein
MEALKVRLQELHFRVLSKLSFSALESGVEISIYRFGRRPVKGPFYTSDLFGASRTCRIRESLLLVNNRGAVLTLGKFAGRAF